MPFVLPQFPVGSVVFPATPVELRVFEPRYLALMGELMLSESPVFGMPLFGQTVDPGLPPERLTLGTMVRVDDFGVTENFMGIQASATQRFAVTRWLEPGPYPRAEVEFLPELVWDEGFESERMLIELEVRDLLARVERHGQLLRGSDTAVSTDPIESLWQLASFLPVQPTVLEPLLAAETPFGLIEGIRAICAGGHEFLNDLETGESSA